MEKKPAKNGMPEIARVPISIVAWVIGIFRHRPPIRFMSCSPSTAWITEPDPRNSRPLKNPWAMRWKIAATQAPMPRAANM